MKSLRITLLFMSLSFFVEGCDDINYGDKIYNYVQTNARRISEEHADADLSKRWLVAQQTAVMALVGRTTWITNRLAAVKGPAVDVSADPRQALLSAYHDLGELIEIDRELEGVRAGLTSWSGACASRDIFELAQMDGITTVAPMQPVVNPDYIVEVNTDMFGAIARMIQKNAIALAIEQQNAKAISATHRYVELALKGDELFAISKRICTKEAEAFAPVQTIVTRLLGDLERTSKTLNVALVLRKVELERIIVPSDIAELLARRGFDARLAILQQKRANERIAVNLALMRIAVSKLVGAIDRATTCDARVSATEELEDALVTTLAQIDVLLGDPKDFSAETVQSLTRERTRLSGNLNSVRGNLTKLAKAGCP